MQILLHLRLLTNSGCSNSRHASRLVLLFLVCAVEDFYCGQRPPLFLVQNSKIGGGAQQPQPGKGETTVPLLLLDNTCGKRDESNGLLLTRRMFFLPTPTARGRRLPGGKGRWPCRRCLVLKVIRRSFVKGFAR